MSAASPRDAAIEQAKDKLTVLTYNVGLLRFRLFGFVEVFSNPSFAKERFPHILTHLQGIDSSVDILCIQECYEQTHADAIINVMKEKLPYHCRINNNYSVLKFHNGLLILSKYPIADIYLQKLDKVASLERHMANKSNLVCTINIPSLGPVRLVNMHTTAGGTTDPEHGDVDLDREDELRQAWQVCEKAIAEGQIPLIIGDLNCGPEASAGNLNYILGKGFRDTFAEHEQNTGTPAEVRHTWDPTNYLNTIGPHAKCPGQRCDHVLIPTQQMAQWRVSEARIIFRDKVVPLKKGLMSTLSDHFGLLVSLEKN